MGVMRAVSDPNIRKHLLREEGEVIVDEVRHHWISFVAGTLEMGLALLLLIAFLWINIDIAWLLLLLAFGVATHASYRLLREHMDRFVITNMRVFRVHGVFAQQQATMPLTRILDITVTKPFVGRLLGFGHFTFESAAQEQGLRDIRFVAKPDKRDLEIQRVIARAGLRPKVN